MLSSNNVWTSLVSEHSPTGSAFSIPAWGYVSVLWCVLVSVWAMSPTSISGGYGLTVQHVFSVLNDLKVSWIHASFVFTLVIYLKIRWNWFFEVSVRKAVTINESSLSVF